ncbi:MULTISPECIES: hypothetical protein [Paraburkholderia]|uniref:hypothetical protein n=1 Tax=Paraburkholderia TaxID=1822464 RepID=UPI0022517E5F|nr:MULTISPECIES: hypothetical protein [Paraburkholderia]MCX4175662.1 hypothetical protein [Paraburkholderia madseniana]MDQ6463657.1 hypothetical protein [Paraburkholderia madseniana]
MARPRIEWRDAALRLIMSGISRYDQQFPQDNAQFLDAVIDEVRTVTGKLYGAGTYARLLRDTAVSTGVTRRPGNSTIQKAIDRAQALAPAHVSGDVSGEAPAIDVHTLRRVVEPVIRDALAPLHTLLAQLLETSPPVATRGGMVSTGESDLQLQITQASLEDAYVRMRRMEEEGSQLRRELGRAETQAAVAETRIAQLLDDLNRSIAASAAGADALAKAAKRLEGTEQFLKAQNDAVRQQATAEVDQLRRQAQQLRERIDHLTIDNDQYRRALVKQRSGGASENS